MAGILVLGSCARSSGGHADHPSGSDAPLNVDSENPGQRPTVRIDWESGPAVGVGNQFLLTVSLPPEMSLQEISVTPWMTIHGHGAGNVRPVVSPVSDSVGVYRVSNVFFVMSGPWDLKVNIRSGQISGGTTLVQEFRVTLAVEVPAT